MNKIYFLAFLLAVASAHLAVDITDFAYPRLTFNCFAGQNVSRVVIQISDEQGLFNKNFLNTYIFAKDAGISSIDAIVIVNDNLTANAVSDNVTHALPSNFNGTVWLRVYDSPRLWSIDVNKRISYLEGLVLAFKQRGVKAGIYSDANSWASVFGAQGAGSDSLKTVPIWYANDNGVLSFDDFSYAGFGIWDEPSMKNYQRNAYFCSILASSMNYYL